MGRYGGEEFVILLPETTPDEAAALAERLRDALEKMSIQYEGDSIQVRSSFGVSGIVPPEEASLEDLLRNADRALYEAKGAGGNQVCVHAG
jgi:diguanylate cyclase (GGDEF)-like protein